MSSYAKVSPAMHSKHIGLIFTGGTFLSVDNEEHGRHLAADQSLKNKEYTTQLLADNFSFTDFVPINIDSSDIMYDDRLQVMKIIQQHETSSSPQHYDGRVVVHGTDTKEYSAGVLSLGLD